MRTALYFPHTEVRSEQLVRTALLQWDQLEYIAPYQGYRPTYEDRDVAEAMELIGHARCPGDAERMEVHELIKELLTKGVPEAFQYSPRGGGETPDYELWPQKFAPDTWELLRETGLVGHRLSNFDYPASQAAGLTVMSILADVLAGETRTRVTDQAQAYAAIANAPRPLEYEASAHDIVVPVTLNAVSLTKVPTQRLIEFRRKETGAQGHQYRGLRHSYLKRIETHITDVAKHEREADREELERCFTEDMERDFRALKDELRFARNEAWLDKGFIALVSTAVLSGAAMAGFGVMPEVIGPAGAAVALAGALGPVNKLAKTRLDVLQKHPMAYLYELQH